MSGKKCPKYCDSDIPAVKFHGILLSGLWALSADHQWQRKNENVECTSSDFTKHLPFLQFILIFVFTKHGVSSCGQSIFKSRRFAFAGRVEDGKSIEGAEIQLRLLCFHWSLEEGRSLQGAAQQGYLFPYFKLQVVLFL